MSKRKLLLADDSITIQKVVNLTFAGEGFEVISVGDGNSAMDRLREDSPDLVLADVNMPGLNGYEICEKIKAANSATPVILLVGSFEPFDEDEAKRVGADDYLTKPFQSIGQLVSKVTELMNSENRDSTDDQSPSVTENRQFENLEDSAIDDEMIQTNQIGSLPIDETSKFETKTNENERLDIFAEIPDDYEITEENYHSEENFSKQKQDFIDTREFESKSEAAEADESKKAEFPMPETASILDLDEVNLLELPPLDISEDETPDMSEIETFEEIDLGRSSSEQFFSDSNDDEIISPYTTTKTIEMPEHLDVSSESSEFQETENEPKKKEVIDETISAELVELLTQKVVARLSDKVIKEIAWEVVPQMTELIIKKMAEEKLKD